MSFDKDAYRDRQLDRHFAEEEASIPVSNCCGEPMDEDECLCPKCKEHCKVESQGDFQYSLFEDAQCDKADAQRELDREGD